MNRNLIAAIFACTLALGASAARADNGRTDASALAADDALSAAIRHNDADGIAKWLDKDGAVISTTGSVGEGPQVFLSGITSGVLVRRTFDTTEARVRLFGTPRWSRPR